MFKTNQYFDGKVMSMAFNNHEGPATVGVMAKGEYEFGTSTVEYMTVISGEMTVLLPGDTEWKTYKPYETFVVEKDSSFKLVISADCAYKCTYK
jgi:purine/pyrimidine-nucleoside phosphorylase